MLSVSGIGQRLPGPSQQEIRLRELNAAIGSIEQRRKLKRAQILREIEQLKGDLSTIVPLGDVRPMIRPIRVLAERLSGVGPLPPNPPNLQLGNDLTIQIEVIRVLFQDQGQGLDLGALRAVSVATLGQLVSRQGALQLSDMRRIIELGLDIDVDGLIDGLNVVVNGLAITDEQLEAGQSTRAPTTAELLFIEALRERVRVVDAANALFQATPSVNPAVSLLAWYENRVDYENNLGIKADIQRDLDQAQASLQGIDAVINQTGRADGQEKNTLEMLEDLREKLQNNIRTPEDRTVAEIKVPVGGDLELTFSAESAGTVSIQVDLLDGPWANQYRAEAPEADALQDQSEFLDQLEQQSKTVDDQIAAAQANNNRTVRPVPLLETIEEEFLLLSDDGPFPFVQTEYEDVFVAFEELLTQLENRKLLSPADARIPAADRRIQAALQNLDQARLNYLQALKAGLPQGIQDVVAAKAIILENRDTSSTGVINPWRLTNRLASLQDMRDQKNAFSVSVNGNSKGLLFTGKEKTLDAVGRITLKAMAESFHTGPLRITVTSRQPGPAPADPLVVVDRVFVLGYVRVMERCHRCIRPVAALDQNEWGLCQFSLGLTSWEREQGKRDRPEFRSQRAQFQGWHCATEYLLRPPTNSRAHPDEWVQGNYSRIQGSPRTGYSSADLMVFQKMQARAMGAFDDVTVPVTEQDLRLFDAQDPAIQAYVQAVQRSNNWLGSLAAVPVQVPGQVPGPLRFPGAPPGPLVPGLVPTPVITPIRSTVSRADDSSDDEGPPTPTEPNAPDGPSSPPGEIIVPETPQPDFTPPLIPRPRFPERIPETPNAVDPSILKGKTEVFESEPEPEPEPRRQPSELEQKFAKAMTIEIIEPQLEADGSYGQGYLNWLKMMRGYIDHLSELESQMRQ